MSNLSHALVLTLSASLLVVGCGKNEETPAPSQAPTQAGPKIDPPKEFEGLWQASCETNGEIESSQVAIQLNGAIFSKLIITQFEGSKDCSDTKSTKTIEVYGLISVGEKSGDTYPVTIRELKAGETEKSVGIVASVSEDAAESASKSEFCGLKTWTKGSAADKKDAVLAQEIKIEDRAKCSIKANQNLAQYLDTTFATKSGDKELVYKLRVSNEALEIESSEKGSTSNDKATLKFERKKPARTADVGKPNPQPPFTA